MDATDGRAEPVLVRHDSEGSRFVVDLPNGQAELIYGEFAEDVLDLQHTEVRRRDGVKVWATPWSAPP
jgi:hypothetical protein